MNDIINVLKRPQLVQQHHVTGIRNSPKFDKNNADNLDELQSAKMRNPKGVGENPQKLSGSRLTVFRNS